ncbi:MAG: PP2C family protein-serine/threonine phosphatase, partial [Nanoarchaeota archaeon]
LSKNLNSFGILIADVSGHMITDNLLVNKLDSAFMTSVAYQLEHVGEITAGLFGKLNTHFYNFMRADHVSKIPFITCLYGEIHGNGKFRFISAGHPPPIVFSNKFDKIVKIDEDLTKTSTPLGVLPSKYSIYGERFDPNFKTKPKYDINEINLLGQEDILILYTDGLIEQKDGRINFADSKLEQVLREHKSEGAKEIYDAILKELKELEAFAPITDDITLVVIKKK